MRDHHPIDVETLLNRVPICDGLEAEELAILARGTSQIVARKNQVIFQRGDHCSGFYVLVCGRVKLAFTSPQGTEKVVQVIKEGQSFCEAMLFMEAPYVFFSQAMADSLLLHVSKRSVLEELGRDHRFVQQMLGGVATGYHQLMLDLESFTLHNGAQRIIRYLLGELEEAGDTGESAVIELDIPKGVIASRLNLTQEHFSRILHDLEALRLLEINGRRIVVPSVSALKKYQGL
ncbi:Crp/Fnr family transcriptional regulator [Azonexus sp.]|uniref:Crp/Fnr family transcriptional regulator n=1 Tax=Azonexus sp. TaxID=1872668 RepID=UPI0035AF1F87